jgi:hypothetical protein
MAGRKRRIKIKYNLKEAKAKLDSLTLNIKIVDELIDDSYTELKSMLVATLTIIDMLYEGLKILDKEF